jgi:predicted AAA+ superfamily ATPase
MVINKEDLLDYTLEKLREAPKLSKDHITKNEIKLKPRNGYFRIEKYLKEFLSGKTDNRFIVMPGLRGIGKTTILFQLYDYLINIGIEQNRILYLSADELSMYFGSKLIHVIDSFISEIHQSSKVNLDKELFIFIDESHYDNSWSQVGKILFDKSEKIFMIFTGSSAISLEMNVDAARRVKKQPIFPMNFSEYLLLKYKIFPPKGTTNALRNLIFDGDADAIKKAIKIENEIRIKTLEISTPLEKEWENYLCCGGFPFGTHLNSDEMYDKIFSMVEKVIQKDVFILKSFKTDTTNNIFNIIIFLALQNTGETSYSKLAAKLGISSALVKTILDVLEKTHLIFNIKPHGGAGKIVRKPWKYYFLSPSIKAAINVKLGKYPPNDRIILGYLAENLVAANFFRMKETRNIPLGISYAPERAGVDFLLHDINGDIIPVEVGIGNKNPGQVKGAIKRYNSEYGILISNATKKISLKDKVIYMPLTTFSFI